MSTAIKPTIANIISLWFGVDTPLRQYRINLNPDLWKACLLISRDFQPPSRVGQPDQYRKSDKLAFARAVQQQLNGGRSVATPLSKSRHRV